MPPKSHCSLDQPYGVGFCPPAGIRAFYSLDVRTSGPANGNGRPARSFRRFAVFPLVDAGLQPPTRGSRWSRRARLLVSFKNWDHRFSGINTFRCGFFFDSKTGGPGPTSWAPIALGMYPPRIHRIFLRLPIDFKPPGSHKCRALRGGVSIFFSRGGLKLALIVAEIPITFSRTLIVTEKTRKTFIV